MIFLDYFIIRERILPVMKQWGFHGMSLLGLEGRTRAVQKVVRGSIVGSGMVVESSAGMFNEKLLAGSRAISEYSGLQGVLGNLPTAAKIRSQMLSSGVGMAFVTAAVKFGRLAERKPIGTTRASQGQQKGLKLSRKMFKDLKMGQSFNGISSSSPEVGLLEFKGNGKVSPSFLSLRMPNDRRHQLEISVSRGLGAGSCINPLIARSQEESATVNVAFTFGVMAQALTGELYKGSPSWSMGLGYLVVAAVYFLDCDPQGSGHIFLQTNVTKTETACMSKKKRCFIDFEVCKFNGA